MAQTRDTANTTTETDDAHALSVQYEVTSQLSRSETVPDALRDALRILVQRGGWEGGAVWLTGQAGDLDYQCEWQESDRAARHLDQIQAADSKVVLSLADEAFSTGNLVWIGDIRSESQPLLRDTAASEKRYSALAVPLRGADTVYGVMALFRSSTYEPDDDDRRMYSALGCDVGQFLYARAAYESHLQRTALLDQITELPGWPIFLDRGRQMLLLAERSGASLAVLHLNLDFSVAGLRKGNRSVANELLILTAERLSSCVRAYDTVARLADNEFMVLLPDMIDADDALVVAQKIVAVMAPALVGIDFEATANTSIGIARHPQDGFDIPTLLQQAEEALQHARSSGINQYALYGKLPR